jgi:hypothetical protein
MMPKKARQRCLGGGDGGSGRVVRAIRNSEGGGERETNPGGGDREEVSTDYDFE